MKNVFYVCPLKLKYMDSFAGIDNEIKEARERRKQLILVAMDGRTQKFIADKTGIDEPRLSKWINGLGGLEETEVKKITKVLGVDFN